MRFNGKVKEVKMERDLFGKILCLGLQRKIDIMTDRFEILLNQSTPNFSENPLSYHPT